ncbi:mucin-2 [Streptomyces bacillaris]|uniref:mucin-2 n=1 Tax=Streptomyces bacillaris TaxID=68179 RepID=UPI003663EF10
MPWFKIDDSAHSHPKFVRAGNAALGLWLRCGAYSAQHLLEGVVPGDIARLYGTAPQAAKLVKVGLWHAVEHECARCPQPEPGSFVIHDFFEGGRNSTRAQVETSRRAAAERQAKRRARVAGEENAEDSGSKTNHFNVEMLANRERFEPPFQGSTAGQEGLSQRDAMEGVTAPQAKPVPSSPTEKKEKTASYAREGVSPSIPEASQPLVAALQGERLFVGWELAPTEWFVIEALIKRCGIPALVASARASWQGARSQPRSARYFLPGWKALPDTAPELPGGSSGSVVPFPGPAARPATTDQRVNAALEAGRRLQQLANARKDHQQ